MQKAHKYACYTKNAEKGTSEWGMSGSANLRKWRVIMKNKKIVQKAGSRFLAMMLECGNGSSRNSICTGRIFRCD